MSDAKFRLYIQAADKRDKRGTVEVDRWNRSAIIAREQYRKLRHHGLAAWEARSIVVNMMLVPR